MEKGRVMKRNKGFAVIWIVVALVVSEVIVLISAYQVKNVRDKNKGSHYVEWSDKGRIQ